MDMDTPHVEDRPAVATAGITRVVSMGSIPEIADRIPDVAGWLGERGGAPSGAPYLRYHGIDMEHELVVEAGFPLAAPLPDAGGEPSGDVKPGLIPAGRYVVARHRGHPAELVDATAALLAWAADEGLAFDTSLTPEGEVWAARLEIYLTDPREEPDMSRWETELAFKLTD